MICLVCKDYNQIVNKICVCNDSVLCDDCLILTNNSDMKLCPICRRNLNYVIIRDYLKYLKLLLPTLLLQFFSIFLPIIYPIHILTNEYNEFNILSLIITIFSVSILQPIVSVRISKELHIKLNKYLATKLLLMAFLIPIYGLFKNKNKNIYYLFTFIFPFYILPTIMICAIEVLERKNNFKLYLDSKTISKQLKFERIDNEN